MKSVIRAEIARPARQEQGYDVYLLFLKKQSKIHRIQHYQNKEQLR